MMIKAKQQNLSIYNKMKGTYYKLPLEFDSLMAKKDTDRISLDTSISQHIFLLATTSFGECKFDETYGTEIWELDFDLLKTDNSLKDFISGALKKSIRLHEKRLHLEEVEISIRDYNIATAGKNRMKKRVEIGIKGIILETNHPFVFRNHFFVGPLSY